MDFFYPIIFRQQIHMIYLFKIMIIGRQPEHRHITSRQAFVEVFGELDRGKGFIDRIKRATQNSYLLPSKNNAGIGLFQFIYILQGLRSAVILLILFF